MYKCCNVRRFIRLLALDAFIFAVCWVVFLVGRTLLSSAGGSEESPVRLPVIMYHSVCGRSPSEYSVTPEQLDSDLKWLSANGYSTVTAGQVIEYTRGKGILPAKSVMITLDDGFYNNLSILLPLLEKYDMTAVVSVVGSYTDVDAVRDPHNDCYSYLTWEDIAELQSSGRVELGNHTYAMHSFSGGRVGCSRNGGETEEDYRSAIISDVSRLQQSFTEHGCTPPVVFAYPFGGVSRESIPILRDSGFLMTLTCRELPNYITRDPNCLYGIGRYNRSGLYSTEYFMDMLFTE